MPVALAKIEGAHEITAPKEGPAQLESFEAKAETRQAIIDLGCTQAQAELDGVALPYTALATLAGSGTASTSGVDVNSAMHSKATSSSRTVARIGRPHSVASSG